MAQGYSEIDSSGQDFPEGCTPRNLGIYQTAGLHRSIMTMSRQVP